MQLVADNSSQFLLLCAAIFNMLLMHKLRKDRMHLAVVLAELEQLLQLNKSAYEEAKKKDNSMRSQVRNYISGYRSYDIDDTAALDIRLANPNPNPPSNMLRSLDDQV